MSFENSLLVSSGAVLGASIRYFFIDQFKSFYKRQYWGIFLLNTFACFALGVLFGFRPDLDGFESNSPMILLISVGLLGSLSTFSTFIIETLDIFFNESKKRALSYLLFSIFTGILALIIGYSFQYL